MSILPTWSIAAGALVVGLLVGAYADHMVMSARIEKIKAATAEVDRQRAEIRAADERDARATEQRWQAKVAAAEQEKTDENARIAARYAAQLASVQQRADRRPTPGGGTAQAAATCAGSTGAELSRPDAGFLVGEAARADTQRAALAACYKAYDAIIDTEGTKP